MELLNNDVSTLSPQTTKTKSTHILSLTLGIYKTYISNKALNLIFAHNSVIFQFDIAHAVQYSKR